MNKTLRHPRTGQQLLPVGYRNDGRPIWPILGASEDDELTALKERAEKAEADAEKWKGLSRKHEEQSKANADKAKKYDDLEAANKSELEKLTAERDELLKKDADRAAKDEADKVRADVAKEKGLSDKEIPTEALRGSTREELEAHADQLLAIKGDKPAAPPAKGQGGSGGSVHTDSDASAEDIVAAATTR